MASAEEDKSAGRPDAATIDSDSKDGTLAIEEMDSSAVAAAMGFSSFGSQTHPNKKRRFNPRADAVVAQALGTGANASPLPPRPTSNLPLHPPQKSGGDEKQTANTDEIDLGNSDDDPEPQYIDTSRPVGEVRDLGGDVEDPAIVQARIDDIVAAGNAAYGVSAEGAGPDISADVSHPALPGQVDGNTQSRQNQQPGWTARRDRHGFRPDVGAAGELGDGTDVSNNGTRGDGFFGHGRGRGGGQGGRGGHGGHGGRRHEWWTNYYDPTTNENPWTRLESRAGLLSPGSWLERQLPAGTTTASSASPTPAAA